MHITACIVYTYAVKGTWHFVRKTDADSLLEIS